MLVITSHLGPFLPSPSLSLHSNRGHSNSLGCHSRKKERERETATKRETRLRMRRAAQRREGGQGRNKKLPHEPLRPSVRPGNLWSHSYRNFHDASGRKSEPGPKLLRKDHHDGERERVEGRKGTISQCGPSSVRKCDALTLIESCVLPPPPPPRLLHG